MDSSRAEPTKVCHVVAMASPGRGHINPMMNLCKLLVSKSKNILVTFVVTEEWLGFIGSEAKPDSIRFSSIPNVVPSERVRGADISGFAEAVMTQLEAPFERLLDRLEPSPSVILADIFLRWVVGVGNLRNIKVSLFCPTSASMFSIYQHFHLFEQNGDFPVNLLEKGMERVDYIPGVSSTRFVDFPPHVAGASPRTLHRILEAFTWLVQAHCLIFTSIYELEPHTIDVLRAEFSIPLYTVGPAIPFFQVGEKLSPSIDGKLNYLEWLDCQPPNSVLYISLGSFMPVCSAQMDEIAAGLKKTGVRFIWVARGETERLKEECGDKGLVVPWCEQLRVLCHDSVRVESYMQIVFMISAATLLLPIITNFLIPPSNVKGGSISFSGTIQLAGFCTFEACVGIFWPSIMKMRSQYIPEEARSTIMNFFRIPLNIFVCVVLYNVNAFPITVMFGMCSIFLFMAAVLQRRLMVISENQKPKQQDWTALDTDQEAQPLNDS